VAPLVRFGGVVYLFIPSHDAYYAATDEQLYILAIFPTDNHRFQNSNDENNLLVFDREKYGLEARINLWQIGFSPQQNLFFSLSKQNRVRTGAGQRRDGVSR